MLKLISFIKALFVPMTVAGVMSSFDSKVKQLEIVAKNQRNKQARHAIKIQEALAKQGQAEIEEAKARQAMSSIKALLKEPQVTSLDDIKREIK